MSKSLWKLVKLFSITLIFMGGVAEAVDVNNALQCAPRVQANSASAPWVCPVLPNFATTEVVEAHLGDIDFKTGQYACTYKYQRSGDRVQGCVFESTFYKNGIKQAEKTIEDKISLYTPLVLSSDINFLGVTGVGGMEGTIQTAINNTIVELKTFRDKANDSASTISKTDVALDNLRTVIKRTLIDPYTGASPDKKDNNFAIFLAGLVTMDSDVVEGYDEATGELMISTDWNTKASTVSPNDSWAITNLVSSASGMAGRAISSMWSGLTGQPNVNKYDANARTDLVGLPDGIKIASWVEIFEMKLWGFYYNLNRRFDIGFDLVSTKILFMMFTWFVVFSGVRRGVGYLLNSDSSFKMTEDKWIKTLVILLSVVTFYISIPSPITSNLDGKSATAGEMKDEFRKNKTLAKGVIRMTAGMGQYMGTMMSDLGLSAYLDFLIKKQNVYAGQEVSSMLISGVNPLTMYYPSLQIVKECRGYYNASDADFFNESKLVEQDGFQINQGYSSGFFTGNKIKGIDLNLCHKSYIMLAIAPKEVAQGVAKTAIVIDNKDAVTATAMKYLVSNTVVMQTKLGWINTFSVPVSYFIMKNANLFLSKGVDNEAVEDKAKAYYDNLGQRDSSAVNRSDLGNDDNPLGGFWRVSTTNVSDSISKFTADMSGFVLSLGVYNMLPAFSGIREAINSYLTNVYTDKFNQYLEKEDNAVDQIAGIFKSFIGKAVSFIPLGGVLEKLFDFIPDVSSSVAWRTIIAGLSYLVAMYMWKVAFGTMLTTLIGTMSLVKIVLYFKNLLVHTMTSLVYFLWAFASNNGHNKLHGFLKDTMILMFYPILIVMSVYIFIFEFELLNLLYTFVMANIVEGQRSNISLMTMANNGDGSAITAYFNLSMLLNVSEIVVQIFGVVLAYLTLMKLPDAILKKIGISEGEHSVGINQEHETMNQRGMDRVSNPMN